jgi:hypothetical protein
MARSASASGDLLTPATGLRRSPAPVTRSTHRKPRPARLTRRGLQLALGLIWLLDACLQCQPYMFSRQFAAGVVGVTAQGNPGFVAGPVTWAALLVGDHPALANVPFALVQFAIAIGRREDRLAGPVGGAVLRVPVGVESAAAVHHQRGAGDAGWRAGLVMAMDNAAGRSLADRGTAVSAALAVLLTLIAVAALVPRTAKHALAVVIVLAAIIWTVPENFGGIFTGQGTDPSTGPLLVLLALAYWPRRALVRRRRAR